MAIGVLQAGIQMLNYSLGSKNEAYTITPSLFLNRNDNVGQGSDSANRFNNQNFVSLGVKINNYASPSNMKEPWYCFFCAFEMIHIEI